jgi:deoxyadenosine/deoxycytidine kinase
LDNVESVGIVSLNVTQWGGVFYSVDLIVTRDRTPKQVFRLLRELAELMLLHYTNPKFPKLPILVETQYTPLLERFFKRVSKEGVVETATNIFCTSVLSFKEQ